MKIEDFKEITENNIKVVELIVKNNYKCADIPKYLFGSTTVCSQCPFDENNIINSEYLLCNYVYTNIFKTYCDEFLKLAKEHLYSNPKLSVQNPIRPTCSNIYELQTCTPSINMSTNKANLTYKLVDNSVEKCITNYTRLLGLMQYGLFITQMDGHLYIDVNYECVTNEAEELQNKIKYKGITFISKVYEGYDEALDRVDNLLEALGLKKLGIVGSYLMEMKNNG